MKNLIKLGDRYINFDNVTDVVHIAGGMPGTMRIFFVGGDSRDLSSEESRVLRDWLDNKAIDLTPASK